MNTKKLMVVLGLTGILSSVSLTACRPVPNGVSSSSDPLQPSSVPGDASSSFDDASADPSSIIEASSTDETPVSSSEEGPVVPETKTYTLHEYLSADPQDFNPHTWETSADSYPAGYCEMGLVDIAMDQDEEGAYEWVYEMATSIENVTQELEFQEDEFLEKWGIGADDTNRVYQIELNPAAQWEDGTPINADTYIESMKRLLDPAMQNYRANTYISGETGIVGAANYMKGGTTTYVSVALYDKDSEDYNIVDEENVYISWANAYVFDASQYGQYGSASDFAGKGKYGSYLVNADGENVIDKYKDGTIITDEVLADLTAALGNLYDGLTSDDVIALTGSYKVAYAAVPWDTVGLLKTGDYELVYITLKNVTPFYFNVAMTSNWIVKTDLYDSLKDTTGSLTTTKYGTDVDKYMSYGPYKMASFEDDKQIKFTRNDKWYGYTDGKHVGQYKTTDIVCDIYPEHNTAMLAFLDGKLDSIELEPSEVPTYASSNYLQYTEETYTMRLVFNSNLEDLQALEATANDGKNKQILAQYDFRKALSLCIDRQRFNREGTAGHNASYGILSTLYYYDVENDPASVYRNTDEAKQAIVDLYDMSYGPGQVYETLDDAYKAVTGLDVEKARELFQSAYDKALAAGQIAADQEVKLQIGYLNAEASTSSAQTALLNEFVAAATEGTSLEGKVTFEGKSFGGSESRYDAIGAGHVEIANCAWGGAAFYPFSSVRVYTDPEYADLNEIRSWNPTTESLTLTYDFDNDGTAEEEAHTFTEWSTLLNNGEYSKVEEDWHMSRKLYILSRLENAILDKYLFAVLGTYASVSLYSQKVKYATLTYNIMYGYGGIRFLDYYFDDAAWDAYCASHTLDYK